MSKYEPLTAFLRNSQGRELRLSFADIERVLGFSLPASKQYPAWWSNSATNNVMTKAWLTAGYKTGNVDVVEEKVTFRPEGPTSSRPEHTTQALPRSPLFGSMKGTTFLAPGVDLTAPMDVDWKYDVYDAGDPLTAYEVEKIRTATDLNTSEKIRALAKVGMPRAEIARQLGKKYQHVRNVLVAEKSTVR